MDIGNCCICLCGFNVAQMGVLPCLHTYHYACVARALRANAECPLCRQRATVAQIVRPRCDSGGAAVCVPNNLPKKALSIAMDYYDRIVWQQPADCASMSDGQRAELDLCLNSLFSTLESQEAEREAQWERLKQFLKVASLAAVSAVLVFLLVLYWPMLGSLTCGVLRTVWSLITGVRDLLICHWPELLVGGLFLTSFAEVASDERQSQNLFAEANALDDD
uniref:RING-type E3 ubiquitin transferase n=1 Tax=Globodera rostochiensis TaxID=31243 RepID=A0A914IES8_GLORO